MIQGDGGFICDVGYSMDHYFKSKPDWNCPGCNQKGFMIFEAGWVGSRILHYAKHCLTYFELSDGGLMWQREISQEQAQEIMENYLKYQEAWDAAVAATGRKCIDCGKPCKDFYGEVPDVHCCCKKDHKVRMKAVMEGKQDMIFPEEIVV